MDSLSSQRTDSGNGYASMNINEIDGFYREKEGKENVRIINTAKKDSTVYECKSKRAQNITFRPLQKPCSLTRKKSGCKHRTELDNSQDSCMRPDRCKDAYSRLMTTHDDLQLYGNWLKHLNSAENSLPDIADGELWKRIRERGEEDSIFDGFDKLVLGERQCNEDLETMIEEDENLHYIWQQTMVRHHHLQPALEDFLRNNIDKRRKLETNYHELEQMLDQVNDKHEKETLKVQHNVRHVINQERQQVESGLSVRQHSVESDFQKIIREKERKFESFLESHASLNSRIAELEKSNSGLKKGIEVVDVQVNHLDKENFALNKENKYDNDTNKDLEEKIMLCDLLLREHKNMYCQAQKQQDGSSQLLIEAEKINKKLMGENKSLKAGVSKLSNELEVMRSKNGLLQSKQKCLGPLQITPVRKNTGGVVRKTQR